MHLQPLGEREGGAGLRVGRAAPLLPTGVIPVDQLCNFTKLEHYRWSGGREGENRKMLNDWRR